MTLSHGDPISASVMDWAVQTEVVAVNEADDRDPAHGVALMSLFRQ
jgi:hypothetical protein